MAYPRKMRILSVLNLPFKIPAFRPEPLPRLISPDLHVTPIWDDVLVGGGQADFVTFVVRFYFHILSIEIPENMPRGVSHPACTLPIRSMTLISSTAIVDPPLGVRTACHVILAPVSKFYQMPCFSQDSGAFVLSKH